MASSSMIEDSHDRRISAEVSSFTSFLTEDMLDAAMTNIQDMVDSDNEDRTSGTSSNVSVKGEMTVQEKDISEHVFIPKTDKLNSNTNDVFVQSNKILQYSKNNLLNEDLGVNSDIIVQDKLQSIEIIEDEIVEKLPSTNTTEVKDINMQIKGNNLEVSLSNNNNCEFCDTEGNATTINLIEDGKGQITDKENCLNTHITAKDNYDNITNKDQISNEEIILIEDSDTETSNKESEINSEISVTKIADELNNQEALITTQTPLTIEGPSKTLKDVRTREKDDENNALFGTKDEIISSIKEAFKKIYTKKENKTFEKTSGTENQFGILNMVNSKQTEENEGREKVISPEEEAGNHIEAVTSKANFNISEQIVTKNLEGKNNLCEETSSNTICNNIENSSNEVDRNFEETMDYDEISDDDCGLEIDDNLEKEIENNLMAEIGLTPQAKKTCFVLDDPEVIEDVEEILEVEREEAEKLDSESITLYRGDDAETTDASSMVECVLSNNEVGPSSSSSQKDLLPNTSYSEICNMIVPTSKEKDESKQMKMIYMNSNKKPAVVKQVPPGFKQILNQNKNVKCVLKLNGNVAVNSLLNKKLKLVPLHKSALSSHSNLVPANELTVNETEFKRQIIENQLPPYKSSTVKASSVVYCCDDCGDTFFISSSLIHHLARRSVEISYWCRICCSNVTFYNRCLLLKHVRLHTQSLNNIDLNSVTFKPISKEMLERGLPKSTTQEWEENSVKNLALKYSITNFQTGKNTHISNKEKTLTSVVNIPRANVAPLASPNNKVQSNNTLQHFKPFTNVNGQNKTNTITNSEFNQMENDRVMSCSPIPHENLDIEDLCSDVDANIESQSSETVSHNDDISHEIQIKEVYSIHEKDKTASEEVNPVVAETVDDFRNILLNKTEEQVPQISVKTLPLVDSGLSARCKAISLPRKNHPSHSTSKKEIKENYQSNSNKLKKEKYQYCSECGIKFIDMDKHLNKLQRPNDANLICRVCRLILPSKCSLKIHLRFHMKLPPYKCPDCGKQFPLFENLLIHIKYVCGHLSRYVKYICSKCRRPCSNLVQLESHIFSLHTNRVFKCSMCPVAFFNLSSMRKHKNKEHPNSDIFPFTYQQCTLCPDLIPKGKVPQHISEHARNPSQLFYAYNCPGCKKWFTNNRSSFLIHLSWCPKVLKELEKFNHQEVKGMSKNERPVVEEDNHNDSGDSDSFHDEPTIIKHPDVDDDVIELNEKDPLSLEDWEGNVEQHVREKRIEMCIVCKKEPVIILPGTDLNTQSLCCKLCVKPLGTEIHQIKKISQFTEKSNITKSTLLSKNKISNATIIGRKRSSRPVKRKMSLDFEYDTSDYSLTSVNSEKSDSTCSSPENKKLPKNRTKIKKTRVETSSEESGINFVSGQIIPQKQSDSVVCSKCGFTADNVDEFRNHVIIHRTDPNAYQCLECGLCFVVRPSLEKHLIVLHRIKNVEEYIQNNDVGGERTVKEETDETAIHGVDYVEENQCRVCFLKLDSPASLDKHFRTHGMAFLMSSQRQSKKL